MHYLFRFHHGLCILCWQFQNITKLLSICTVLLDINVICQDRYSKRDGFQMSTHALPLRHLASEIKRDGFQMSTHAFPLHHLASEIKRDDFQMNTHTHPPLKRERRVCSFESRPFLFHSLDGASTPRFRLL